MTALLVGALLTVVSLLWVLAPLRARPRALSDRSSTDDAVRS